MDAQVNKKQIKKHIMSLVNNFYRWDKDNPQAKTHIRRHILGIGSNLYQWQNNEPPSSHHWQMARNSVDVFVDMLEVYLITQTKKRGSDPPASHWQVINVGADKLINAIELYINQKQHNKLPS